jgi:predicted alpha/beta-fold hydrolase
MADDQPPLSLGGNMKSHYCKVEKETLDFEGECSWCGEKEMNANELADELDKSRQEPFTSEYLVGQAATMLRQKQAEIINKKLVNDTFADLIKLQGKKIDEQQAEIEALKKQVEVLSTAFETACDGLKTSLDLNKAQAERYWNERN